MSHFTIPDICNPRRQIFRSALDVMRGFPTTEAGIDARVLAWHDCVGRGSSRQLLDVWRVRPRREN